MRIGVCGGAGRMGQALVRAISRSPGATVAGATERHGHPAVGSDVGLVTGIGQQNIYVGDDAPALFAAADVVIDFTTPEAAILHARLAAEQGTALVVGTTGLGDEHHRALREAGQKVAIVQAANMSVGVNLLLGLTQQVASVLGDDYDVEIVEMHHRHKVDAPSGTALALGQAAAAGRGISLQQAAIRARDGQTGPRPRGSIGFATLRGGDVVGEHAVIFAADGERIEVAHKASSRDVFAVGAVRAALWLAGRPAGLYSMQDVLGLTAR